MTTTQQVLLTDVPCPVCQVPIGKPCTKTPGLTWWLNGQPWHWLRWADAAAVLEG